MRVTARGSILAPVLAATAAAMLVPSAAKAVAPTPGDLLIYRTGDGSAGDAAAGVAASVFIDEYTTAGSFVRSYPLPNSGSDSFTDNATSTTEGGLSLSLDGQYAVFTGYHADHGTTGNSTSITQDTSAPRAIGRLNLTTGATDTNTTLGTSYFGSSIRGVASTDGSHFWTAGTSPTSNANGGVVYVNGTGPTATTTILRNANLRGIGIFGGELYANNSGTTFSKMTIPVGSADPGAPGYPLLPTQFPVTNTTILGSQTNISGFAMYDLDPTVAGIDTLYFPSGNAPSVSLLKYTFDGTTWNAKGSASISGVNTGSSVFNIAGKQNTDGSLTFFLTSTGTNGGTPAVAVSSNLYTVSDSSGFSGSLTGAATQIATSDANTTFRGLALIPGTAFIDGDVNHDHIVDLGDVNYVTARWLNTGTPGSLDGDANGDGTVDLGDINFITARWLNTGEPGGISSALASVPEPATLSAAALAALPLLARRRRR